MAEVSTPERAALWRAAWRGEDVWEALFEGYRAAVDWPVAAFWPQLMRVYPEAKILLTIRDAHSWYRSARNTIFQRMMDRERLADPSQHERVSMAREIIASGTFDDRLDDEAHCIDVFEANVARCKAEVPRDRLIVFEASQGWAGLCEPLGLPIPDREYPSVNSTAEFRARWAMGASPDNA